jgi:hypothetical protein
MGTERHMNRGMEGQRVRETGARETGREGKGDRGAGDKKAEIKTDKGTEGLERQTDRGHETERRGTGKQAKKGQGDLERGREEQRDRWT